MINKTFYVYKLINSIDRRPFYVGKGTGRRMYDHVSYRNKSSHSTSHNNLMLKNKINKIIANGGHIIYHRRNVGSEAIAFDLEKRLIAKYGRRVEGTGILCNMTNGGEGVSGHQRTAEWKRAASVRAKNTARAINQYTQAGMFVQTWLTCKDACGALSIDPSSITRCCGNQLKSAGGFRWTWKGDQLQPWVRPREPHDQHKPHKQHKGKRPVHQFTLDGHYIATHNSMVEAGRVVGKHANTILECCKGRSGHAGGYRWSYQRDTQPNTVNTIFQYTDVGALVRGYTSAKAAALATAVDITYIQRAIRTSRMAGGFYWSASQLPHYPVKPKRTSGRQVSQHDVNGNTVATYSSVRQAQQHTGILGITNCVTGRAKTAGGYTWAYVSD